MHRKKDTKHAALLDWTRWGVLREPHGRVDSVSMRMLRLTPRASATS